MESTSVTRKGLYVIWIDPVVFNEENEHYTKVILEQESTWIRRLERSENWEKASKILLPHFNEVDIIMVSRKTAEEILPKLEKFKSFAIPKVLIFTYRPDLAVKKNPLVINVCEQFEEILKTMKKVYKSKPVIEVGLEESLLNEITCPISGSIMDDPVIACDGRTYDRSSISTWLKSHNKSPITNESLANKKLIPNYALKSIIEKWKKINK